MLLPEIIFFNEQKTTNKKEKKDCLEDLEQTIFVAWSYKA